MTDIDELLSPNGRKPCKVGRALAKVDEDVRAKFDAAFANDKVSGNKITLALAKAGIVEASPPTVRWHRDGHCGCDEPRP
jgi:hypothetical protein